MAEVEQNELLLKLRDTNALIDPVEVIRLIEEVGGWIDDLDLEIIELDRNVNYEWFVTENANPDWPKIKVTNTVKGLDCFRIFRERTALLKRLRRHYRLLNTKLNLLTKPKGR